MQNSAYSSWFFKASQSVDRKSHLIFCPAAAAKWLKGMQNRLEIGRHILDDVKFAHTSRTGLESDRTINVKNAESCNFSSCFLSQVSQSIENLISFFAHAAAKWLKGTQNR